MKTIYLIKSESPSGDISFKIGITGRNPQKRLSELQIGTPDNLHIICTFESKYGNLLESTLHNRFNMGNIHGEWFSLTDDELKNFLNTCYKIESNLKIMHEENTYFQSKKR